jgi:hypothetical protein
MVHSTYQQFIKDNYHKCSGTPQERMKQCAAMYQEHKAKGGVLSGAGVKAKSTKSKSKGGLLSGASLEKEMEKLKIFKEHTPKPRKARGGVLSGAGMGQTDDSQGMGVRGVETPVSMGLGY